MPRFGQNAEYGYTDWDVTQREVIFGQIFKEQIVCNYVFKILKCPNKYKNTQVNAFGIQV